MWWYWKKYSFENIVIAAILKYNHYPVILKTAVILKRQFFKKNCGAKKLHPATDSVMTAKQQTDMMVFRVDCDGDCDLDFHEREEELPNLHRKYILSFTDVALKVYHISFCVHYKLFYPFLPHIISYTLQTHTWASSTLFLHFLGQVLVLFMILFEYLSGGKQITITVFYDKNKRLAISLLGYTTRSL